MDSPRKRRRSVFVASANFASDNRASSGNSSSNLMSGRASSMSTNATISLTLSALRPRRMSVESSASVLSSIGRGCTQSVRHRRKLHNRLKTNAARLLDALGIRYEIREYEVDVDDLSAE